MKSSTQQFSKVAFSCIESANKQSSSKHTQKQQQKHKLNLFGKGITHIKPLSSEQLGKFSQIKQLDLSHNAVSQIQNISSLALQQLNLSHNKIQEQQKLIELFVLNRKSELAKSLKKISLKGNPFMKKNLSPQVKRWLFSVSNDLEVFLKEQVQLVDMVVQRIVQKITLENILGKVNLNIQFVEEYSQKFVDDYEKLILLKPQEYFKTLKRQMEHRLSSQHFSHPIKRQFIFSLPLQLFNLQRQKVYQKYISPLMLQLKKQNEQYLKHNKQTMGKIQESIFNYLTIKKIILEKRQKSQLQLFPSSKTPIKKLDVEIEEYPNANTPIYGKEKQAQRIQIKSTVSEEVDSEIKKRKQFERSKEVSFGQRQNVFAKRENVINDKFSLVKPYEGLKIERNPFDEIIEERQKSAKSILKPTSKQNIAVSPLKQPRKVQIKNSSKTLFQLSQSLLQRPVMSEQSIHFELEQGISQSQIDKMYYQILTKLNPIYHLLYSPLQSLKTSQRNSLITNLLQLLKQKLKYIEKLEKFKFLYEQQKVFFQELTEKYQSQKTQSQGLISNQELLKIQVRQMQNQVQRLSSELQSLAQENFWIKQTNQNLKRDIQQYKDIKIQRQFEQEMQERIKVNRQFNLKKNFLEFVSLRARKHNSFNSQMKNITEVKNHTYLRTYFETLKTEAKLSKKQRNLYHYLRKKYCVQFFKVLIFDRQSNGIQKNKTSQLKKVIKIQNIRKLFKNLKYQHTQNQKNLQSLRLYSKTIKRKLLKILKSNRQNEKSVKHQQLINQFRLQAKQNLKQRAFKQWLLWQKSLLHKQVQVRINHEGILACNVIQNLCNFYTYQNSLKTKAFGLELYLLEMRKTTCFKHLCFNMSLICQRWKMKLFKINMLTKRIFFDDFLSGIRKIKNKKRIRQLDEKLLFKKLEKNEFNPQKFKRHLKLIKFQTKIRSCNFQFIKKQLCIGKNEINAEKIIYSKRLSSFFDQLRRVHKAKSSFKSKQRQVNYLARKYREEKSSLRPQKILDFFKFFKKPRQFKSALRQFFINKSIRLMKTYFYQFTVSCLQQKSHYYQQKLRQLGPDIDLIEERQIQSNIEKTALAREIQQKNMQIQEYEKQVRELKLLLQAKEIKYEKLRDIYAQTVEINVRERQVYEMEMQKSIVPSNLSYNLNEEYLEQKYSPKNDNFLKTIKLDAKYDQKSKYSKYSPEQDIKAPKDKIKIFDYLMDSDQTYRGSQYGNAKPQSSKKDRISDFYPSFRRF